MKRYLILCFTCLIALSAVGQRRYSPAQSDPEYQLQKFNQFYTLLGMSYVDTIDFQQLTEQAIEQVLSQLDPHSAYIPAKDMKQVNESFSGSFSGIGIEFNVLNDTLLVVNTIVGAPAEKVGVLPNDRIVEIDGEPCIGITQTEVPGKLRGPKGTVVEISVLRRGEPELLSFRITRDDIPIHTVDAAYLLDKQTGYVKVNRFAETTMSELNAALDKLGRIDALVLDLRGNGGGLMGQAIQMAGTFLEQGAVIVSTEGLLVSTQHYENQQHGRFRKGRLIVLIDENSASGSEIVAGAIQDWDRGLIVGRRSFGKGLVQRQFDLIDGSSVRITIARYHTPTGRVIQRPFEMGQTEDYYLEHYERYGQADTIAEGDSLIYKTLHKGRSVYGGGGITPDRYVPVDTTGYSDYWARLVRRGVINEFIIEYIEAERASIERQFADFEQFMDGYKVDQPTLDRLIALGEKREIPFDEPGFETSRGRLESVIKALVAQKIWTTGEYYQVMNSDDEMVREAREILKDWNVKAKEIL